MQPLPLVYNKIKFNPTFRIKMPGMDELASLVSRLEAVASRLEGTGGAGAAASSGIEKYITLMFFPVMFWEIYADVSAGMNNQSM